MALPDFDAKGDLPPGIYPASLAEVLARFGQGSAQRRAVAERLDRVYRLAGATGHVARFVVFGSFVTAHPRPLDVDVFLLLDDSFDVSSVTGEAQRLFYYPEVEIHFEQSVFWTRHRERTRGFSPGAQMHFGASVLWKRRSGALTEETAMMELWQENRGLGRRGIVEIVPEAV